MHRNTGTLLVEHCAPTLAGIKVANMFSVSHDDGEMTIKDLRMVESILSDKGIKIELFGLSCRRFLVYVYREKELERLLERKDIRTFLSEYGYSSFSLRDVFSRFEGRLVDNRVNDLGCFPHEIGILLGYPIADVEGFIRDKGQNPVCSGCWKAYGDRKEAEERFCRIDECRCKFKRLYEEGASIYDLTACAV